MAYLELNPAEVVAVRRLLALDGADHPDYAGRSREVLVAVRRLIPCERVGLFVIGAGGAVEVKVEHPVGGGSVGPRVRLHVGFPLSGRGSVTMRLERVGRTFEPRHAEMLRMLHPVLARQLRPPVGVVHAGDRGPLEALSVAELQVLRLVAGGATNQDAAVRLDLSEATVRKHLEHVYRKLGVTNRTAAAALVITTASA